MPGARRAPDAAAIWGPVSSSPTSSTVPPGASAVPSRSAAATRPMSLTEVIFSATSSGSGSLSTISPCSRFGAITLAKFSMKAVARTIAALGPDCLNDGAALGR